MTIEKSIIKAKPSDWRMNPINDQFIIGILIRQKDAYALYPLHMRIDNPTIMAIEIDPETIREWTGIYDAKKQPAFVNDRIITAEGVKGYITKTNDMCTVKFDGDDDSAYPIQTVTFTITDDEPETKEKRTVPSSTLCNEIINEIHKTQSKAFDPLWESIEKGATRRAEAAVAKICSKYSDVSTETPELDYKIGDTYWTIEYMPAPKTFFSSSRITDAIIEIKDILTNTVGERFLIVENKTNKYRTLITEDEFRNTCRCNSSQLHKDIDKIITYKLNQ